MERPAPLWWRFTPGGGALPGAAEIGSEAATGRGALSRLLRDMRFRVGAQRTASLLRAAEAAAGRRFGTPAKVLLVTSLQPRSLADALTVSFAVSGLALDLVAIEGVGALGEALRTGDEEGGEARLPGLDLALLCLPRRGETGPGPDATGPSPAGLASTLAARTLAPVAVAEFRGVAESLAGAGDGADSGRNGEGVSRLVVPIGEAAVFDDRFGASFGAILSRPAADALGDGAAGLAARLKGLGPKLAITDLDGVLWSGILGEGETLPGGAPAPPAWNLAFAEALSALRRRGLVLALASRNDPADVDRVFGTEKAPLRADDFVARAVGWEDKGVLVARVLEDLGLAAEHALFLDDDAVNCARVAARFPDMDVRRFGDDADAFAADLLADPLLRGVATAGGADEERGERTEQYRLRSEVERLRTAAPDIAAFLAGLGTRVTAIPLDATTIPRAAELAARVNQFRFTDLRPNALELAARRTGLDFLVRLDDAFGPHGLVGLVLASQDGDAARIDTLLLSCRALERGIESAMLEALARLAEAAGLRRLVGRIEALARNEPARDCLQRHGFALEGEVWCHALGTGAPRAIMTEEVTMTLDLETFDRPASDPGPVAKP